MPEYKIVPEYKVVPMSRLMEWPSQAHALSPIRRRIPSANLTTALKQMASEGWELVSTYGYHKTVGRATQFQKDQVTNRQRARFTSEPRSVALSTGEMLRHPKS